MLTDTGIDMSWFKAESLLGHGNKAGFSSTAAVGKDALRFLGHCDPFLPFHFGMVASANSDKLGDFFTFLKLATKSGSFPDNFARATV